MKRSDLTYLNRWIGKLVIYHVSKTNNKPTVVYITGAYKHGSLSGKVLNTDIMFIGSHRYCIEYTPRMFERLLFLHQRKDAITRLETATKRIKSGKY